MKILYKKLILWKGVIKFSFNHTKDVYKRRAKYFKIVKFVTNRIDIYIREKNVVRVF